MRTRLMKYLMSIMGRKTGEDEGAARVGRNYDFFDIGFHGDRYLLEVVDTLAPRCGNFVETGANVGSTLAYVGRKFPHLECISCEPDPDAFAHALKNTAGLPNIKVYNETSQSFLRRIEREPQGLFSKKTLFWLDAHGYGFQWPLKEELRFITTHFGSSYILIDDFKVPGLDCFGYDAYAEQECSFEYIRDALNPRLQYNLCYPNYTEITSAHHPLRGWVLIEAGQETKPILPDTLVARVRCGAPMFEAGEVKLSLPLAKSEIIASSLQCKGWTDEAKLSVLYDLIRKTERLDGDILEIGSAWGRSTVLMGLASDRTIWSVDPHTGGLAYIQKGESQGSYDEFVANLKKHDLDGKVKIVRYTTQEAASRKLPPPEVKFAFVFIDGLHTAEGVKADIEFAYDRLVPGGAMVFDDYFEPSVTDYASMIDKMLDEKKAEVIKDNESKLVYVFKSGD